MMVDEVEEDGISARVELDPETDRYVIDCFLPGEAGPSVSLRVPRAAVERAVLNAIGLTLELGPDGTVMAYAQEARLGTLASAPLAELVRRAVVKDWNGDGDRPDQVAGIVSTLEEAMRLFRQRQSQR